MQTLFPITMALAAMLALALPTIQAAAKDGTGPGNRTLPKRSDRP